MEKGFREPNQLSICSSGRDRRNIPQLKRNGQPVPVWQSNGQTKSPEKMSHKVGDGEIVIRLFDPIDLIARRFKGFGNGTRIVKLWVL